ncbi:MAG TPA: tannase/feruloyl esterase family alpha/beta hydrolase [Steroidobacteraceae bacterium]|nr:tannase/feruloyl esterase family alpha/beta hydrolase [Steroidobacteraceae bacterium]
MRARSASLTLALLGALAFQVVPGSSAVAAPLSCESMVSLRLSKTTLAVQSIYAEAFAPSAEIPRFPVSPFCRVSGVSQPAAGSRIGFELWMPKADWNGRLKMLGNGGYSSALPYAEMGAQLKQGYAVVATDTGHTGDSPDFAKDQPEAIVDWGYRAVHLTALNAKRLVTAFYGRGARYSYFQGCSTGGHQALMEAQRFPEDFDGIVAGAPGNNRTHLTAAFLWQFVQNQTRGAEPRQIVPARKLALLSKAVLSACKSQNGPPAGGLASDPFLNDPLSCNFDPATLACASAETDECLTTEQVTALKRMYAGAQNPRTGEQIYFGWPPGSEASTDARGGWSLYWADPQDPTSPARADFWRYWAFKDRNWTWQRFDFDRDMQRADDELAPVINAMNANLEKFRKRGGKLIQYHGMADPVTPFADSIAYQQRVVVDQLQARGLAYLEDATRTTGEFYRLFLAPGLGHCQGGAGAEPKDMQQAIENWVERGEAPNWLLATRGAGGVAGKGFSRPLCPYPQVARYNGSGAPDDAGSFTCAAPTRAMVIPRVASEYLR